MVATRSVAMSSALPVFADSLKCVLATVIGDSDLDNDDRELSR